MPKRTDIGSILVIGAGPIIIGQGCEFDYSGTQACRALREEGYRVILVNSNPATIMTDPDLADATYMEPITPEFVSRIIEQERPDALLPTMGGQTALNCALALHEMGVLEKFGVEIIGADINAINMAEDREQFRRAMQEIGLNTPDSVIVRDLATALDALTHTIGLPAIIRPSFTLGGTGGGIAYNREEFARIVENGLDASPVRQVLVEKSVLGWKEYEMEVVRDRHDNCIIVCCIENIDPMGIHTGDSITVAPALTLTDKEYQDMRNASFQVLSKIGVAAGGANVQFAVNPEDGQLVVIEMNPRVSRSSALASKATGFPIAKISAKLAVGYTLDELSNDITGGAIPASFEPSLDYIVTKIPRFAFEKFSGADPTLNTTMKAVGEVMGIGRTFQESLQKALRSMEIGLTGLNEIGIPGIGQGDDKNAIRAALGNPTPDRLLKIAQALRLGTDHKQIYQSCRIDPWFIQQIQEIVDTEFRVKAHGLPTDPSLLRSLKAQGFSDSRLAELSGTSQESVRRIRKNLGILPVYKRIDTCAAEFLSPTDYIYSTYETPFLGQPANEALPSDQKKVIILGGGPNRIGQGIEFDYCCCHAAFALREIGIESVMVNCNPETVSTDYDTSDRLYFEPLTAENVLDIVHREQENGTLLGVIVQFGGQTPLNLAHALREAGVPILGTSPDDIDHAEDRNRFKIMIDDIGLKQPQNSVAHSLDGIHSSILEIGYPVVVRPSYVLGGRAMEIIHNASELECYLSTVLPALVYSSSQQKISDDLTGRINAFLANYPLLIDRYLENAIEVDVDSISDGKDVFICGIMEHIEEAGIHSGDSACSIPPYSLDPEIVSSIRDKITVLAKKLNIVGLMNAQFAIVDRDIYILEVNPRASRTIPFVAKFIGRHIARIATRIMMGESLTSFNLVSPTHAHVAVKEAVFPFVRFPGVDTVLGPEMRSTGEVIGIDRDFAMAFAKSQIASGNQLPVKGTAFVSVRDRDKLKILPTISLLQKLGFHIVATSGTQRFLSEHGLACKKINKVLEGRPHVADAIKNGDFQLIINTTEGIQDLADSQSLRWAALLHKIPHYTTVAGAKVAAEAIRACREEEVKILPIQSYFLRKSGGD